MNVYQYSYDELKACRVCLNTDTKLFHLHRFDLLQTLYEFSGTHITNSDGLPQYICFLCYALLKKSSVFRNKCRNSHSLLLNHLLQTHCSLAHLKCHQRTHTGEKPYKCNMCDKDFAQYSTLKCHIATHTGERAYKCSLCGKAFVQPAHLRAHMFTHTKERPYACNMCEKRYRNATSLKEHKDTIHMGLPHRKWGKKNKRT